MPVNAVTTTPTATQWTAGASKTKNDLSMQDFFSLLSAQLQNQNMMDPVSDTEFLSQMAQFSALTATQELNTGFSNFMAVSYIGKTVKATQVDANGVSQVIQGVAEKVEFSGGETFIHVGGVTISPSQITEVTP